MNWKMIATGVIGFGAGILVGKLYFDKKWELRFQDEYEKTVPVEAEVEDPVETTKEEIKEDYISEASKYVTATKEKPDLKDVSTANAEKKNIWNEFKGKSVVEDITEEEYFNTETDYEKILLYYYNDDILVTEDNTILGEQGKLDIFGTALPEHIYCTDDMFFRNNALGIDYRIIFCEEDYE